MDVRFRHPFTCIVAGPTGSGKTVFTFKLIEEAQEMISPPPERIMYCYGEYQAVFSNYPQVEFIEGLPDLSEFDGKQRILLIIDDLMREAGDSVEKIFTKMSHHRDISVIFLTQNLFFQSKNFRTMSINSKYLVVFMNPRDASQIATLGQQMFPNNKKFLVDAFRQATEEAHGYLLIDLHQETPQKYRIRSHIFDKDRQYVYVPK